MSIVWSDAQKYRTWLEVGLCALEAQAELRLLPAEAVTALRLANQNKPLDEAFAARIAQLESQHINDMQAFSTALEERFGHHARLVGKGLTATDMADTALAITLKLALEIVLRDVRELRETVRVLALRHKHTPCVARLHGVHGEPTTFGLKCLNWFAQLGRDLERIDAAKTVVSVAMLSGTVGTYRQLDPKVEALTAKKLFLTPDPITAQAMARDRHAQVMAALAQLGGGIERIVLELRHLAQTEIAELSEPSSQPQRAPSVRSESITGLVRVLRGQLHASLETVALWGERDLSHSSVERLLLPDATTIASLISRRLRQLLEQMVVHPERMWHNLDRLGGVVFQPQVLAVLETAGLARDQARSLLQRLALQAWERDGDFRELLEADPENPLSKEQLEQAFDVRWFLREVDTVFARFGM